MINTHTKQAKRLALVFSGLYMPTSKISLGTQDFHIMYIDFTKYTISQSTTK